MRLPHRPWLAEKTKFALLPDTCCPNISRRIFSFCQGQNCGFCGGAGNDRSLLPGSGVLCSQRRFNRAGQRLAGSSGLGSFCQGNGAVRGGKRQACCHLCRSFHQPALYRARYCCWARPLRYRGGESATGCPDHSSRLGAGADRRQGQCRGRRSSRSISYGRR